MKNKNFRGWYPRPKMTKTNQNFHHWYPWPKNTKKKQSFHHWYSWPKMTKKKQKLDIPTTLAFQGNFSSNEHCTNVFTCLNLLRVCARRNLATEKNISLRGDSTEIVGIFTLARNPLRTAEADILTLLQDFCDNSQTANVTFTRKVL